MPRQSVVPQFILGLLLALLFLSAWLIQSRLFLNYDVSWLLLATQRLLAGETYTQHYWETNPPLIFYLYLPPLLFTKAFGVKLVIAFRAYIFLLAALSLGLCRFFLLRLFPKEEAKLSGFLLLMLATVFLLLPIYEFGQRDHLLIILSLPYFLLLACRLQGQGFKPGLLLVIGLLAGLGFGLKPHFLLAFVLVELYYLWSKRLLLKPLAWLRLETAVMLALWLSYLVLVVFFYPDFIHGIVPYALRFYYSSVGLPFWVLAVENKIIFCYFTLTVYGMLYSVLPYKKLGNLLCLALLGFLLAYFAQRAVFYYHQLPAFSLALLLLGLLFYSQINAKPQAYLLPGLAALLFFIYYSDFLPALWTVLVFNRLLYFVFFAFLFAAVLVLAPAKINAWKAGCWLLLLLALGFWSSFVLERISWSGHQFLLVTALLIFCFGALGGRVGRSAGSNLIAASLGALFFAFPAYTLSLETLNFFASSQWYATNALAHFMKTEAKQEGVYFFLASGGRVFPSIDYAEANPVSRFYFLWPVSGIVNQAYEAKQQGLPLPNNDKEKHYVIGLVAEDLKLYKPRYVFVDSLKAKVRIEDPRFDYLSYFLENADFKQVWKNYRYLTTLKEKGAFQFDVYKLSQL